MIQPYTYSNVGVWYFYRRWKMNRNISEIELYKAYSEVKEYKHTNHKKEYVKNYDLYLTKLKDVCYTLSNKK